MFLDYLSLAILLMGLTVTFYTFIYIHDLPHKFAKKRGHPNAEAIGYACWLSLFTLHAIWPLVFIWAVMHKKEIIIERQGETAGGAPGTDKLDVFSRLTAVETRLLQIEEARLKQADPTNTNAATARKGATNA